MDSLSSTVLAIFCYIKRACPVRSRDRNLNINKNMKSKGVISISSKGTGYVKIIDDRSRLIGDPPERWDPEVDFKHLNTALHGDMVEIILHPKIGKNRPAYTKGSGEARQTAEVSKIISRAKIRFAGVLEFQNGIFFLKPDDTKMYTDILIPEVSLNTAKAGQKVFVEIVSWTDARKAPEGRVLKILGKPGDNNAEMHAIAMEKGFDSELPKKVDEEAKIGRAACRERE